MPARKHSQSFNARTRRDTAAVDWSPAYLAALEESGGSYKRAAAAAGVVHSTVFRHRRQDAKFASDEREALERARDTLISAAVERAVHGVERVRFQPETAEPFYDREYIDTIPLRFLERADPSFRQKQQIDHNHGREIVFATRAQRKAALERARKEAAEDRARANGSGG